MSDIGGRTFLSFFNPVAMFIGLVLKIGACNPHQPHKMKDFVNAFERSRARSLMMMIS